MLLGFIGAGKEVTGFPANMFTILAEASTFVSYARL
jgi:hypothetical protein